WRCASRRSPNICASSARPGWWRCTPPPSSASTGSAPSRSMRWTPGWRPTAISRTKATIGWKNSYNRCKPRRTHMVAKTKNAYQITLPSETEMVMTRVFNAPRALVFQAHIDPALVAQWWGPRAYTTIVDKLEARPGGQWRFINRRADGSEEAFRGEFREIVAPERITWTFEWE